MNGIQSLYTVGIALCLFSSGIVSAKAARVGQPISYFAVYLALESLCFLFELLIAHPATPLKALWLGLLMSTSLLIAPFLWLAITECVEGARPALSSIGRRQRAVIVSGIVMTLPLIQTAHFGPGFSNPHRIEPTLLAPAIHPTMLMCLALFAVQVPFYLSRCRRILLASRASHWLDGAAAGPQERRWLQIPLIIVGTTWLLGVLRTITGALSKWSEEFAVIVALIDVSVTLGAVYLIVRRVACQSPMHGRLEDSPLRPVSAQRALPQSKYAKSPLDPSIRSRIVRKLEAAFGAEELHRDSGLSLGSLSDHINESEHYVSQVINQELDSTFCDFLNLHRIEHAKRLLIASPDRNVLDVALAVGFNAKSTFNSAFRRNTGMTPREFRSRSSAEPGHSTPGALQHPSECGRECPVRSD